MCSKIKLLAIAGAAISATCVASALEAAPSRQRSENTSSGATIPPNPPPASTRGAEAELRDGQQETLARCMSFWDASTQMSKREWRQACIRTRNGLDVLGAPNGSGSTKKRRTGNR